MDKFELPEKWYCRITNENYKYLNNWRINIIKFSNDSISRDYEIILQDGSGGFIQNNESKIEITFDQFKQYVLKEYPFKIGDKLKLINSENKVAKIGDIAEVVSLNEYPEYINIKWISKTDQNNGDYFPQDFELYIEKDWTKATKEELLEEAKKKYPVGTKFISVINKLHKSSVKNNYYAFYNNNYNEIVVNSSFGASIYKNGKWAEIISLPEENNNEQIPEYVEFLKDNFTYFTKNKIYPLNEKGWCMDNDGKYDNSMKYPDDKMFLKPSTKEAFDTQNNNKKVKGCLLSKTGNSNLPTPIKQKTNNLILNIDEDYSPKVNISKIKTISLLNID